MVDSRGTVDLRLRARQMASDPVQPQDARRMKIVADREFSAGLSPDVWIEQQMLFLATAAVLEARLLNVRRDRLTAFGLSRDPGLVTLSQLAHLQRPHFGTAGQAFELAVADACNLGVPDVVGPISAALRALGVRDPNRPRMIVLGMEKLAGGDPGVLEAVRAALPSGAQLRHGRPGRPANVDTTLRRLAHSSWQSMNPVLSGQAYPFQAVITNDGSPVRYLHEEQAGLHRVSQLRRCDAFVYTETALVPASLKINSSNIPQLGWMDVPLWITTTRPGEAAISPRKSAQVPIVVACLNGAGGYLPALYRALEVIDVALARIDLPRSGGPEPEWGYPLVRQLFTRRKEPVAQVVADLRAASHPTATEAFGQSLRSDRVAVAVPTLNAAPVTKGWRVQEFESGLLVAQRHLFLSGEGPRRRVG